jgi:CBS domain containing-hemolysin-like protein
LDSGLFATLPPALIDITFYPADPGSILGIFIILFLLAGSALISGSEVAYFSLSPVDKQILEDRDSKNARVVLELIRNPERLLGTILITNNFINIGIVILSSFIMNRLMDFGTSKTLQFLVQVVIVTFVLLLFGEILPKLYANLYASRFARFMAWPLKFFEKLFYQNRPIH